MTADANNTNANTNPLPDPFAGKSPDEVRDLWDAAYLRIEANKEKLFVVYLVAIGYCRSVAELQKECGDDYMALLPELVEKSFITRGADDALEVTERGELALWHVDLERERERVQRERAEREAENG